MIAPDTLVVGIGNAVRGDDAVGLLVSRRVRDRGVAGVTVRELGDDGTELLEAWESASVVVIVDATASGSPPGTITCFDAVAGPLPAAPFAASTHALGVARAIELARALGRLPQQLLVLGIEGRNFDLGEPLSPDVAGALDRAATQVLDELAKMGARFP